MKISIITICYNRKETIANCIESVLSQDYSNIEYIVIDGNSTDGTKEIIQSYGQRISTYLSEPDNGMYDAINKGLKMAEGDVIGLMHSDDEFYDNEVISKIAAMLKIFPSRDGIYGDGIYVTNDREEKIVRTRIGGAYDYKKIKLGWLPLHPTVYLRKNTIEKLGYYNLDFKIASDTEFLLRYLFKSRIKLAYLNTYLVKMRMGGLSTSRRRAFEVLYEDYRIYRYHDLPAFSAVFRKKLRALKQYLNLEPAAYIFPVDNGNDKNSSRALTGVLFLICTAAVFYYSWLPSSNLKTESYLPQIIIEWTSEYLNLRTAVPFLLLGFLYEMRWESAIDNKEKKSVFVGTRTIIMCTVIVCLAEAGQFFLSNRHPDFRDVFFGITGGICGGTTARSLKKLNHYFINKNA